MKTPTRTILAAATAAFAAAAMPAQPAPASDAPMRMHEWVLPFFPTQLTMAGIERGEVRIAIEVDAAGRLADMLLLATTDQALVRPTQEALRKWTFEPAIIGGMARGTIRGITFDFRPDGLVVVQNANSGGAGPFLMEGNSFGVEKFDYEVSELKDLDRIPAPVHVVRPAVPARPAGGAPVASITVDFYIDERGDVRMPSVSRSEDNALAWAAVRAVAQWKFAPPTVEGAPVTVHATQEFVFRP
jgi:TonB family protein